MARTTIESPTLAGDVAHFLEHADGPELVTAAQIIIGETGALPEAPRRSIRALLEFGADVAPELARSWIEQALTQLEQWPTLHRRASEAIADRLPYQDARLHDGAYPEEGFLIGRPSSGMGRWGTSHGSHAVTAGRLACRACFEISGAVFGYRPTFDLAALRLTLERSVAAGGDRREAARQLVAGMPEELREAFLAELGG